MNGRCCCESNPNAPHCNSPWGMIPFEASAQVRDVHIFHCGLVQCSENNDSAGALMPGIHFLVGTGMMAHASHGFGVQTCERGLVASSAADLPALARVSLSCTNLRLGGYDALCCLWDLRFDTGMASGQSLVLKHGEPRLLQYAEKLRQDYLLLEVTEDLLQEIHETGCVITGGCFSTREGCV